MVEFEKAEDKEVVQPLERLREGHHLEEVSNFYKVASSRPSLSRTARRSSGELVKGRFGALRAFGLRPV